MLPLLQYDMYHCTVVYSGHLFTYFAGATSQVQGKSYKCPCANKMTQPSMDKILPNRNIAKGKQCSHFVDITYMCSSGTSINLWVHLVYARAYAMRQIIYISRCFFQ